MSVDINTYNSPAGKIDLTSRGTLTIVKPGTVTVTGTINTVGGAVFSHGSDVPDGWTFGAAKVWMDITSAYPQPVYYSFVPSPALPAAGCMVAVYAEFEHATINDQWNGKGEVALYGRFDAGGEDIRLLMYMGKTGEVGPCASGGWLTPGDGQSTCFIVHYRDIFDELSNLQGSGYDWSDILELRFIFRNETEGRKVKIRDFRIYENVVVGPSGVANSYSSTLNSVTFDVDIAGTNSTIGAGRAGIYSASVEVASPTLSLVASASIPTPVPTITGAMSFTGLPPSARTEFIILEDTYGNINYVDDSYGCLTKTTATFTAVPDAGWEEALLTVSITDPGLTFMSYCFYQEKRDEDGVVSMVALDSKLFGTEPSLPYTKTYTAELDPTGGAKFQAVAYARGVIDGTNYFFKLDSTVNYSDTRVPEVMLDAYSAQNRGFVSLRASDTAGIKKVEYILKRDGQPDLPYDTTTFNPPYLPTQDDSMDFVGTEGETVTVDVIVTDGQDNSRTVPVVLEIYGGGDILSSGFTVAPEITAAVSSDGHVKLEWTSWAGWMPPLSGVRYPPVEFEIYRKTEASGTYAEIADNLPATTREHTDETLTEPAVYYYCVVGVDKFGQRKSIEIAADVGAATTQTRYSFVENYLAMLPMWTAAAPKTDTFGES